MQPPGIPASPVTTTRSGTALRSSAWEDVAGPELSVGVDTLEAGLEARIIEAIDTARHGALDHVAAGWVEFLQRHMHVAALAFRSCGQVLEDAAASCPVGPIAHGLSVQASMQIRQAQAIVLYALDLGGRLGSPSIDAARSRWQGAEEWSGVRSYLEAALALDDWGRQLVAIALCHEPLVAQLMRRELVIGRGPVHGDPITAAVAQAGQDELFVARDWTLALVQRLTADARYGEANRELLCRWLGEEIPAAIRACGSVAALADELPSPAPPGTSLARVMGDHEALLTGAGLWPG